MSDCYFGVGEKLTLGDLGFSRPRRSRFRVFRDAILCCCISSPKTGVLDPCRWKLQPFELSGITHTVTQHPIREDRTLPGNIGCSFSP